MNLLNLAPHLFLPPKDGADLRTWSLSKELENRGHRVSLLSRFFHASSVRALAERRCKQSSLEQLRSIVSALLLRRCYWQAKMLTGKTWSYLKDAKLNGYDAVIINFLYSAPLLKALRGLKVRLILETHNFDEDYFSRMARASANPLIRYLCFRAVNVSAGALHSLPSGLGMSHVSRGDASRYTNLRTDLEHAVVPNGCFIQLRKTSPCYSSPAHRQLLFIGSLSSKMNCDALNHFERTLWPYLADVSHLTVGGSNPSRQVMDLCQRNRWILRANISEQELHKLYEEAHFVVLPFAYAAGSKLKLLEAIGRGVPVVSTQAGVTGVDKLPDSVFVSNDPDAWSAHIRETTKFYSTDKASLQSYSWESSAGRLEELLNALRPIAL
jgi:glycosyltransferase involved in cell wall biosynthesis